LVECPRREERKKRRSTAAGSSGKIRGGVRKSREIGKKKYALRLGDGEFKKKGK